jgi:hypothetical protein
MGKMKAATFRSRYIAHRALQLVITAVGVTAARLLRMGVDVDRPDFRDSTMSEASVALHVPVDRQDLAGYGLGCIGRQKDSKRGDVIRIDEVLKALILHCDGLDLFDALAVALARVSKTRWMRSPATAPGRIAFARILYSPSSIESVFVNPMRPHFAVA